MARNSLGEALEATQPHDTSLRQEILCRRSQISLNIKQYDSAYDDAVAALDSAKETRSLDTVCALYPFRVNKIDVRQEHTIEPLVLASNAAYGLRRYQDAHNRLSELLQVSQDTHAFANASLACIEKRLQEQNRGDYDFKAMAQSARSGQTLQDLASYTCNTKIEDSGSRGRGLFAAKDIQAGELVLCEKAFCTSHTEDRLTSFKSDSVSQAEQLPVPGTADHVLQLARNVRDKLTCNPSLAPEVMDLHSEIESLPHHPHIFEWYVTRQFLGLY